MADPADFVATLETAVDALLVTAVGDADEVARHPSDFDTTHLPVPPGEARFQLQSFVLPQTTVKDANVAYFPALLVRVLVHYHLAADEDETDWTSDGMQDVLYSLVNPLWWRALAGVHELDVLPTGSEVRRVGAVVSFTVTAGLTLNPNA